MSEITGDKATTLETLKEKVRTFVLEREWGQYQLPKNIAMGISIESAELMEFFLWVTVQESVDIVQKRKKDVEHEIADIAVFLLSFCAHNDIDLSKAIDEKLKLNALKYPVEKAKGKWAKYTDLE